MNPEQYNLRIKMVKLQSDKKNVEKWLEHSLYVRQFKEKSI